MASANPAPDELSLLREQVSTLQKENSLLRQKIDALCRRLFGSSSEKIDAAQLVLQLVNADATAVIQESPARAGENFRANTPAPRTGPAHS
jgi:hypothetical protein